MQLSNKGKFMMMVNSKDSFFAVLNHILGLMLSILIASFAHITASTAQEMQMQCGTQAIANQNELICDFRFSEPQALEELTFTANGHILEGAVFTPYSGTGSTSAMLFLVDVSDPKRAATVKRNLEIVSDQLRFASASRLVGLATFANKLELIYKPQESHSSIETRLNGIKADGAATEFFSSSLDGINMLKDVKADRRVLIIMSDGRAEDTAYDKEDVIAAAKDAGITIIGLGFAEAQSETPYLQEIRRLAEDTGGFFTYVVGAQPFPEGFLTNLHRYIENGGSIKSPLNGIDGTIAVNLLAKIGDGKTLEASETIQIAGAAPVEEIEPPLISNIYGIFDGFIPNASIWAERNAVFAYIILVLIPLLILLPLLYFLILAPNNDEYGAVDGMAQGDDIEPYDDFDVVDDNEETQTTAMPDTDSYGQFEIVGSEENTYPILAQSVSIGRHADNDIQLTNDSVHRHHAHFHISPEGVPTIHDLDTINGIFVNSNKIQKIELRAGDIIELGEVRLRYNP